MARKVTQFAVKKVLQDKLELKEPMFRLRTFGGKVIGSIVSVTFRRKSSAQRQRMIWGALETALGRESVHQVGMLLAYTPDEWDFGAGSEERIRTAIEHAH